MKQIKLEVKSKKLIEVDGLKFKDLNGNGKLDPYEDWRLTPEERAKDLVSKMNLDEKVGMMMITTQNMGKSLEDKSKTSHKGVLNEEYRESKYNIFADQKEYGNSYTVEKLHMRHFILRENIFSFFKCKGFWGFSFYVCCNSRILDVSSGNTVV